MQDHALSDFFLPIIDTISLKLPLMECRALTLIISHISTSILSTFIVNCALVALLYFQNFQTANACLFVLFTKNKL